MNHQLKAFENGIQFAWNSTSIKLVQECLYKYKLIMIDGWQSPELSVHLRFGIAYATALEHYFKYLADGLSSEEALVRIIREAMIETWNHDKDEEGNLIKGTGAPHVFDHNAKTRENLIRSIIWYFDHFKEDTMTTIILSDGRPAVEHTAIIPVENDILFTAHLDRLVEYTGNPMVMDQKTTGTTITPRYFDGYNPDVQMSMYTFIGKATFGIPIKGVVIDAAQIAVGFTRFERGFTFRTDEQLDEWYNGAMYHIETAQAATRENYFPMNQTACGNYGGCPFREACSRSPKVREQFLKARFVQGVPMDPLSTR